MAKQFALVETGEIVEHSESSDKVLHFDTDGMKVENMEVRLISKEDGLKEVVILSGIVYSDGNHESDVVRKWAVGARSGLTVRFVGTDPSKSYQLPTGNWCVVKCIGQSKIYDDVGLVECPQWELRLKATLKVDNNASSMLDYANRLRLEGFSVSPLASPNTPTRKEISKLSYHFADLRWQRIVSGNDLYAVIPNLPEYPPSRKLYGININLPDFVACFFLRIERRESPMGQAIGMTRMLDASAAVGNHSNTLMPLTDLYEAIRVVVDELLAYHYHQVSTDTLPSCSNDVYLGRDLLSSRTEYWHELLGLFSPQETEPSVISPLDGGQT